VTEKFLLPFSKKGERKAIASAFAGTFNRQKSRSIQQEWFGSFVGSSPSIVVFNL